LASGAIQPSLAMAQHFALSSGPAGRGGIVTYPKDTSVTNIPELAEEAWRSVGKD